MVRGDAVLVRECLTAPCISRRTTRGKTAAHWQACQIRRLPWDRYELFALHAAMHCRVHQSLRIRVRWLLQDAPHRTVFDNPPSVHHPHLLSYLTSHSTP